MNYLQGLHQTFVCSIPNRLRNFFTLLMSGNENENLFSQVVFPDKDLLKECFKSVNSMNVFVVIHVSLNFNADITFPCQAGKFSVWIQGYF